MRRHELSGSVECSGRFVKDRGIGLENVGDPRGDVERDLNIGDGGLPREANGVVEKNLVTSGLNDQRRDPSDCQALVELALSAYGGIDVLCNLAGTAYFNWLEDITDEEWDRARWGEVDLVFYLTRAAWPHLKDSRGVVVNMASQNASLSFKILRSLAHTTNKAGIIATTRQLAMEGESTVFAPTRSPRA
jgi:NAD(P)-dependent dehydrogenase (short-subunit alcohol dehydrogenase family)